MQIDFDRLSRYHEDGKIRHSVSTERPDLHVWCYSQATVYNEDWDDLTRLCRGLVTDSDCCPAGPARIPVANVAIRLTNFGFS